MQRSSVSSGPQRVHPSASKALIVTAIVQGRLTGDAITEGGLSVQPNGPRQSGPEKAEDRRSAYAFTIWAALKVDSSAACTR